MKNPFSCCLSNHTNQADNHAGVVAERGNVTLVEQQPQPLLFGTNTRQEEVELAESIYHDARQSLTASMMYPPATAAASPTWSMNGSRATSVTYCLDENPKEPLLMSTSTSAKVQRDLQKQGQSPLLREQQQQEQNRGYPGYLTVQELEACLDFRRALETKRHKGESSTYSEMVYCYEGVEEEAYALCRFMRARKFVVQDAFAMMDSNVSTWKEAKAHDHFYANFDEALGCPASVLWTQLPIVHYGLAKSGSFVAYFQVGSISLDALECLTDLPKLVAFVWHEFMYTFKECVQQQQQQQAAVTETTTSTRSSLVVRCEITLVIDLKNLNRSLFTEQVMAVLKECCAAFNCFPEILNKMIIVNAPYFFSIVWMVIRQFLDARTVAKIDIYSKEVHGLACISEHICNKQLLSDYGGSGPSFDDVLQGMRAEGTCRQLVERFFLAPRGSEQQSDFDSGLRLGLERATVVVYTRSSCGATFTVFSKQSRQVLNKVVVKPTSADSHHQQPYSRVIDFDSTSAGGRGDTIITVSAKSCSSGTSTKDCFIVVVLVYNK